MSSLDGSNSSTAATTVTAAAGVFSFFSFFSFFALSFSSAAGAAPYVDGCLEVDISMTDMCNDGDMIRYNGGTADLSNASLRIT